MSTPEGEMVTVELVEAAKEVATYGNAAGVAFVWVPVSKLEALRTALEAPPRSPSDQEKSPAPGVDTGDQARKQSGEPDRTADSTTADQLAAEFERFGAMATAPAHTAIWNSAADKVRTALEAPPRSPGVSEGEEKLRGVLTALREEAESYERMRASSKAAEVTDRESGKIGPNDSYIATWNYYEGVARGFEWSARRLEAALLEEAQPSPDTCEHCKDTGHDWEEGPTGEPISIGPCPHCEAQPSEGEGEADSVANLIGRAWEAVAAMEGHDIEPEIRQKLDEAITQVRKERDHG